MNTAVFEKNSIKKAAAGAIAGASYIFITRSIGTFNPFIFRNLTVTRANTALSFIAAAVIMYFYIVFYDNFAKGKGRSLERASYIMLVGSLLTALLFFKGILTVFDIIHFRSVALNLFIPVLSSLISLYFFVTIYRTLPSDRQGLLRQAAMLAAFGSVLSIFIRAMVIYNFFANRKFEWLFRYTQRYPLVFVPITVFIFLTAVYFFFACYRELKTQSGD